MRKYSDLLGNAVAAAALAAAILMSPWLTRALTSVDQVRPALSFPARAAVGHSPCQPSANASAHSGCASLQQDRSDGVVTAEAGKPF